jgi:hypothetical protein
MKHVQYQRVTKAVGRCPTVKSESVKSLELPESVIRFQRLMTQIESEIAEACGVPGGGEACGVIRAGGGDRARVAGTPRRSADIHYPFQKGGHTFRVCRTTVNSSIHSKSMGCGDVKLSDEGMSWQRCGDNCGDNCGDKNLRKTLGIGLLRV